MKILKSAMEGVEIEVPMISDGSMGYSWTNMEDCK